MFKSRNGLLFVAASRKSKFLSLLFNAGRETREPSDLRFPLPENPVTMRTFRH
jgi:hypothetical protein